MFFQLLALRSPHMTVKLSRFITRMFRSHDKVVHTMKNRAYRLFAGLLLASVLIAGCSPNSYRREADETAAKIIERKQLEALGKNEPFTIEPASQTLRRRILLASGLPYSGPESLGTDRLDPGPHWPEKNYPGTKEDSNAPLPPWNAEEPLKLTMDDALQIAARNNRDYQRRKEDIFQTALDLDLERDEFRNTFAGIVDSSYSSDLSTDPTRSGIENSAEATISRQLKGGAVLTGGIAVDLVNLLTLDQASSFGILADATISIPLLRGSGKHIAAEPLTQAERNVVYEMHSFERFKRTLAVNVATEYLFVLERWDRIKNAESNYRSLVLSARRARRLAEADRMPQIQVDQALQNELSARDQWIAAQQSYASSLDSFKITLGLPTDANIELDRQAFERLAQSTKKALASSSVESAPNQTANPETAFDAAVDLQEPSPDDAGPLELESSKAVILALENRLDLRTAIGKVNDAQRNVVVAADNLRADLTLGGTAQAGGRRSISSVDSANAQLRPDKGFYSAGLFLDLPLERTAERNAYRNSYILLERAVRNVQELEDRIKLEVRNALRNLLQARESIKIQALAVQVATRRVASTQAFLDAGDRRAEIRDVLEAQEDLVAAQNDLTTALVDYRVGELELQRDMGLLEVNEKGLWREYRPEETESSK